MAVAIENPSQSAPKQNWVLSPMWDMLLIIAAPVLWFLWAAGFLILFDVATVLSIFFVCNVAHHFPTFIRIYGDRDLLKRFRWSLLLGPVIPFSLAMLAVGFMITNGYPVENVLFLLIILTIWDPWHFLMQHYGFVRIYDRHNQAPRDLASWMDLAISATWFVFILVATMRWLPALLYKLYCEHRIPLLFLFSGQVYRGLLLIALTAALAMSATYVGYLVWCRRQGFYVSPAKLALTVVTLLMVYLTYVPNSLVHGWIPEWNFQLGFAAMGMLHVSQYFAIVWKYNRMLATRGENARPGWFRKAFSRGGAIVLGGYVLICLLYGFVLTQHGRDWLVSSGGRLSIGSVFNPQWIVGTLLATNFTSTLMHYYYDGFIWKVRHKENRQNLDMQRSNERDESRSISWWETAGKGTAPSIFAHHLVYFGLPIAVLAISMTLVRSDRATSLPLRTIREAADPGETKAAMDAINGQLDVEKRMIDLQPTASHYVYLAELTYTRSLVYHRLFARDARGATERERHEREISKAVEALEAALQLPGPYAHREDREMHEMTVDAQRQYVQKNLDELRRELAQLQ